MGRPTRYTPQLAEQICRRLAMGESLRSICREEGMPGASTVIEWVYDNREGFADSYARARKMQAELLGDELMEIADDGKNDWMERERQDGSVDRIVDMEAISRSRLRVDTRKWYLSKVLAKVYGDRQKVELTGKDGETLKIEVSDRERAKALAMILSRGAKKDDDA